MVASADGLGAQSGEWVGGLCLRTGVVTKKTYKGVGVCVV